MTWESGLGVANSADGYIFLVERAPKDESTLPEYYVVTPKKTFGPYGGIVPDGVSPDGKQKALCVSDYMPQYVENANPNSYVIFNDGTQMGPYKGYTNVTFSADNSEWVIASEEYNNESTTSKTTLQFKGGKPLRSDGSEYVLYAPKGNYSARVKTQSRADGTYVSEYYFSDGKKIGPVELIESQFSADGKSYGVLGKKNGKMYFFENGKENPVPENANTFVLSPDGSDWAVMEIKEDNSGSVLMKSGRPFESSYIVAGSLFYDELAKCFGWMTAESKEIKIHYSNGKQLGPIKITPNPVPAGASDGVEGEVPSYYVSGMVTFSEKKNKWIAAAYASDGTGYYYFNGSDATSLKGDASIVTTAFDANNNLYYVTETEVPKAGQDYPDYAYNMIYPETGKSTRLEGYPSDLQFIEGRNMWYMTNAEGELVFSDGTRSPNAFGIRYDKTEGKIYWMTLDGQDIFLNKKLTR